MYYDPTGHLLLVTLACIGISALMSFASEAYEDWKNDGKLGNGDKDPGDYLGAIIGGAISGLGKGFIASTVFGVLGDVVDSYISGELTADNALATIGGSLFSNVVSFGVSEYMGNVTRKAASYIKAYSIINMKDIVPNNKINKILKPITNGFNIGANNATWSTIGSKIYFTGKYGKNLGDIVGAFF